MNLKSASIPYRILLFIGVALPIVLAYNGYNGYHAYDYSHSQSYRDTYADFPGQYCAARNSCCTDRQDSCAIPISNTLCYCDDFCDRSRGGDCCPDYLSFCKNINPPPQPILQCYHNNRYYNQSETFKDNCNTCKCMHTGKVECTQDTCLVDDDIIHNVNSISDTLGWTARKYNEFWGRKFNDGLQLRLGTKEPTYRARSMSRLTNKMERLPRSFNAVDNWPGLLSEVRDQGWCGSSWAVSTTSVASDRFAIQSKGKEIVQLAPQNILSCVRRQQGCQGGHLDVAWRFINKQGVVDEDCYPYAASTNYCKVKRYDNLRTAGCRLPTKVDREDLYTVGPAYSLNNETDIMIEIMDSGPVQATMRVYRDFFSYNSGVYKHSAASRNEQYGFHSVRLVGWGEEYTGYNNIKYWVAANSWGSWWGERGFFRILRGVNECMIEDYVLASWPHVYNSHIKVHRRRGA